MVYTESFDENPQIQRWWNKNCCIKWCHCKPNKQYPSRPLYREDIFLPQNPDDLAFYTQQNTLSDRITEMKVSRVDVTNSDRPSLESATVHSQEVQIFRYGSVGTSMIHRNTSTRFSVINPIVSNQPSNDIQISRKSIIHIQVGPEKSSVFNLILYSFQFILLKSWFNCRQHDIIMILYRKDHSQDAVRNF